MFRKYLFTVCLVLGFAGMAFSADFPPDLLFGADTAEDLYSPGLAGSGAFSTSTGGAPASAVNPAAGAEAQRIVFDAGYLVIPTFGGDQAIGHAINLGALFPTKYAVFGGSVNFLYSPFEELLPDRNVNFKGNLNVAKELYPGLDIGVGLNFGFGNDWVISGDLGARYNWKKVGMFDNFTTALVFKSMGKSVFPSAFTPLFGISADVIHLKSNGDTADPLKVSANIDIGIPSIHNLETKLGATVVVAELFSISFAWGLNGYENIWGPSDIRKTVTLPSVGVGVNLVLKSGGRRLMGGRLPSDGDLTIHAALKPMYSGIAGIGSGITWNVGVLDQLPPRITVDYPDIQYFSPNNDGLVDYLEFPIKIQDQRYVNEWSFEIKNGNGEVVRTYRNKELRPETQGIKNIFVQFVKVKAAVEIPNTLRWDGIMDSGEIAPDGVYTFTVSASDDNGNSSSTEEYQVVVDNTPPAVSIAELSDSDRIFSPDGDGNKDTLTIGQSGSYEDRWDAGIYDAAGKRVKSFEFSNTEPPEITWDGTGDEGVIVSDGVYEYRISSVDRAQNSGGASMGNILISTIQPVVSMFIADAWFSPNKDGVKDTMILNLGTPVKEGIVNWEIRIKNAGSNVVKNITGSPSSIPARFEYDGTDNAGAVLPEGTYTAELLVQYRNGYVSTAVSPPFTLDITPPVAAIRADYTAFSPNNDGNQDEMIFAQEGSEEALWFGEVRQGGTVVRTVRMNGKPDARYVWDGLNDSGSLVRDGQYSYQLRSTDEAGNTGRSNVINFTLSTADTPVFITTDTRSFSPNGDGIKDTIAIIPQLQERSGVASYRLDILDAEGTVVRSFEGQNQAPSSISWNGRNDANTVLPDGTYSARIEVRYTAGNQPTAASRPFILDTVAPSAEISAPFTLFSPNGDGRRDFIPMSVTTDGDDDWLAVITGREGNAIRTWSWKGTAPEINWDGSDEAGNTVADGSYTLTVSSVDEAGNSFRGTIDNIQVDARTPRVFLTSSGTGIAPKDRASAAAIRLGSTLSIKDGIESWKLELKDESGAVLKTFPERNNLTASPPETINWDGRDDNGVVREGKYTPILTVSYLKGDIVTAQTQPVQVDVTGPILTFEWEPEYFSPDNDGVDDELIMFLTAQDASPLANWSLEIREPQLDDPSRPPTLFYRLEGKGAPAEKIEWDGRSNKRELVQSATDYLFIFKAADILGNESSLEGLIGVDVLVIRDGDRLKIQVPSITFRANAADFNNLPQAQIDNNNRILRRIAQILNKFRDYRVQIEGHANPTSHPVPPAEAAGDQTLSEQRARATVDFLVGFGVSRSRLSATGKGSTEPIIKFEDRNNWWKNRRVEFILIK
ncbi:MAG: gliding motility-associated C-terminal domain-containing protein [Treponema sp.]|jgi:flagellar hook assembly protein FlgD/outer membrane protein OmpA-like peptidoglycan-associated protein|nr:gliding motility-associated C-terminal domain-containing protein [Treponema sp.]